MNALERSISSWTLGRDQIDLWCVRWDAALALQVEGEYRAVLPAEEAATCDRFVFDSGRHQCLISRVLVRTALSAYTDVRPESWRFSANPFGKPHIAHPAACPLRFNLSHSSELIVCAVSLGWELGVDVEALGRQVAEESIARHYFAADEISSLLAVPTGERPARFLEFWTLKEAFLKAHGAGLSIPLKSFSFRLAAGQSPQIHFHDHSLGDPCRWQFLAFRFDDRHQMAVAVERPAESPMTVRWIETVPLRHARMGGSLA